MTNAELQILLTLKDRATKDLQTFQGRFTGSIQTMGAGVKNFVSQHKIMIAAIIAGATYMVKEGVQGAFEYGEEIAKLTKQTGLTTDAVQKLRYAAQQEHLEFESLVKLFPILSQNMLKAKDSQKEYEKGFGRIGISVTDAKGNLKSAYDVMLEMANWMKTSGISATEKMAMAKQLLGKSAADAVPFLQLGREEIERLGDEAERTGGILSIETIAGMKLYGDKMLEIKASVRGFWGSIVTEMLPAMNAMADWMRANAPQLATIGKSIGDSLSELLSWFVGNFLPTFSKGILSIQWLFQEAGIGILKFFQTIISNEKYHKLIALSPILSAITLGMAKMGAGEAEVIKEAEKEAEATWAKIEAIEQLQKSYKGFSTKDYQKEVQDAVDKLKNVSPGGGGLTPLEDEKDVKKRQAEILKTVREYLQERMRYVDDLTLYQKRALIEDLQYEMEHAQLGNEVWEEYYNQIQKLQDASKTGWTKYWEDLGTYWTDWGQTIEDYMGGLMQTLEGGFSTLFTNILEGQKSFTDIIGEFFNTMKSAFFKIVAEMLAKWVMANIMQKLLRVQTVASEISGQIAIAIAKSYAAYAGIPFGGLAMGAAAAAAQVAAIAASTAPFIGGSAEEGAVTGGSEPFLMRVHPNEVISPLEKLPSLISKILMPTPAYAGAGVTVNFSMGDVNTDMDFELVKKELTDTIKNAVRGS